MGDNGPKFPPAPGSWGFGPQAGSYQRANHAPPQPGTAMMHNTIGFNNAHQQAPPPMQGPPAQPYQGWYNNF
jgi:hypothetical protein